MTNKLNFLNPFSKKYKKVLAFDGGGVRAIMGIYFFKKTGRRIIKKYF